MVRRHTSSTRTSTLFPYTTFCRTGVRIVNPEPLDQCAVAELDEHGRVLNGEVAVGEMVNTTGAAAFEGYWKNPEADTERVRHGWFWTGDLGIIDKDGLIYFAGRSGDWIRVDSENISALLTARTLRRPQALGIAPTRHRGWHSI